MTDSAGTSLVIGIDGGGTKTDVCVSTERGQVVGFATGGGANWEGTGLEAVGDVLHRLVGQAVSDAGVGRGDIDASAFCLAGVDWPSDFERLTPHIDALGIRGPRTITNDSFAALRAGTPDGYGCVSIAGTGGVAAGRNRAGEMARTMGVGMGEGAGAWGLVAEALVAIAGEYHLSGPPTELTKRLLDATDSSTTPELFEALSRGTKLVGSELAMHVLDASRAGDPVAAAIARRCGDQHGRDTAGVARRLGMTDAFDVVLAGGVHVGGEESFRSGFTDAITSVAANLRVLTAPPVAGAALLALELLDIDVHPIHAELCDGATLARSERHAAQTGAEDNQ